MGKMTIEERVDIEIREALGYCGIPSEDTTALSDDAKLNNILAGPVQLIPFFRKLKIRLKNYLGKNSGERIKAAAKFAGFPERGEYLAQIISPDKLYDALNLRDIRGILAYERENIDMEI